MIAPRATAWPLAAILAAALSIALTACESNEPEVPSTDDVPRRFEPPDVPSTDNVPRRFFGVVPQAALNAADLERMGQGKVGTLRTIVPWGIIDATPAEDFNFEGIDPIVLGAAEEGIEVLPFFFGTPPWVAIELEGVKTCEEPTCSATAPSTEEGLRAWEDFVGAAVDRYGPGGTLWKAYPNVDPVPIRSWQIWNEQNSPTFYQPAPDVEAYAKLVATASRAIKERDPEAQVVLGGLFGTPNKGKRPAYSAWDYLRKLYAVEGAAESFDGVAAHPYGVQVGGVQEQVERLRDEVARAGDDASMWITEIGWASTGADVPLNRGRDGQAERLIEAFYFFLERRLEWQIETVTWYSWRDRSESEAAICDWCAGSGLFPADSLQPKPAWDAFAELTGGS